MRIAVFTNNYLPFTSGVSRSVSEFKKMAEKKGHTVYVFAPKYPNYEDKEPNVIRVV
jgi:1,2-diacylglycerol 3-alpha-glucosyltransferase